MSEVSKPHTRSPVEIVREALEHVRYDERDGYTPQAVTDAFQSLVEQNERQATNIDALYRQRRDAELACELTREENTRLLEQLETLERLKSAVVNAAVNGENEYIRSWCNLALAGAGIEPSNPASEPRDE